MKFPKYFINGAIIFALGLPFSGRADTRHTPIERCPESAALDQIDFGSEAALQRSLAMLAIKEQAPRLFYALGKTRHAALKRELAEGDDPNVCALGLSILTWALENDDMEAVKILLNAGAQVDKPADSLGSTPLLSSVWRGFFDVAHYLIDHGADVHAQADNGNTALHELMLAGASSKASTTITERRQLASELVEKGLPVDTAMKGGTTPLMLAARFGDADMVSHLLTLGADVHARNNHGQTALDMALQKQQTAVVQLLRSHGG